MAESFDPQVRAEFDKFAESYDALHAANIAISGEGPEYFAVYKQKYLRRLLPAEARVLDFGCGIGNLTRLLVGHFAEVAGYDPSGESVALARQRATGGMFYDDLSAISPSSFDAVILANVLHHVEPANRPAIVKDVGRMLAPGGRVVIFEHNPYNPVTRRVVRECAFDENAVLLFPEEAKRLLRAGGLRNITRDFIVFFPHVLSVMRPMEGWLSWLPLGAQYVACGMKAPAPVQ